VVACLTPSPVEPRSTACLLPHFDVGSFRRAEARTLGDPVLHGPSTTHGVVLLSWLIGLNLLWAGLAMPEQFVWLGGAVFLTGLTVSATAVLSR
jgi:hypothetical protein